MRGTSSVLPEVLIFAVLNAKGLPVCETDKHEYFISDQKFLNFMTWYSENNSNKVCPLVFSIKTSSMYIQIRGKKWDLHFGQNFYFIYKYIHTFKGISKFCGEFFTQSSYENWVNNKIILWIPSLFCKLWNLKQEIYLHTHLQNKKKS